MNEQEIQTITLVVEKYENNWFGVKNADHVVSDGIGTNSWGWKKGMGHAIPEGTLEEWDEIRSAMSSRAGILNASHKRLAVERVGKDLFKLWSPRNAFEDKDDLLVTRDELDRVLTIIEGFGND